jgi:hypothetical protein
MHNTFTMGQNLLSIFCTNLLRVPFCTENGHFVPGHFVRLRKRDQLYIEVRFLDDKNFEFKWNVLAVSLDEVFLFFSILLNNRLVVMFDKAQQFGNP